GRRARRPPSSFLLWLGAACSAGARDGAGGAVRAHLHPIERNQVRGLIGAIPRLTGRGTEGGDVQDSTTGGDDVAVALRRPGVGHLHIRDPRRLLEATDHVALRGRLRVARRRDHHRYGPALVELGGRSRQAPGLAGTLAELQEARPKPGEDSLGLGITEGAVEFEDLRSGLRDHQPGVEYAHKRRDSPAHQIDDGPVDGRGDRVSTLAIELGYRRAV